MILIVDDHDDTRRLLQRLLRSNGFDAASVSDGDEAIAYLKQRKADLVILDDMMPKKTGLDVLETLRQDSANARLPILIYSAGSSQARRKLARELGATGWITKGADGWGDLLSAICAALKGEALPRHFDAFSLSHSILA